MKYYGLYRAKVTVTNDPENLGRVKALVPAVMGEVETNWAWPVQPNIDGIVPLTPASPVWIAFEGGEIERPVWVGTWVKLGTTLPPLPGVGGGDGADETLIWMVVSP